VRIDPSGFTEQPVSGTVAVSGVAGIVDVAMVNRVVEQGPAAPIEAPWSVQLSDGEQGIGVAAHPVRTDPTGSTTQPVEVVGTVPVSLAGTLPVSLAGTLPVSIAGTQAVSDARIAAAAATADALANPTAGLLQSLSLGWNGATWDRLRSGLVGVQTTFAGLLNAISMGRYNAAPIALADGNVAPLQVTSTGALKTAAIDVETAIYDLTTTCSAAGSTTTSSATVTGLSRAIAISIEATLQGPSGSTLDVYLQHSPDGGTTWYDYAHFSQLAASQAVSTQMYVPGIGDKVTVIGKGATPLLAANTFVGGHPFDAMKMVMVTGAGTTLGKSQVMKIHVTQPKA
jgi:hypothetical protein